MCNDTDPRVARFMANLMRLRLLERRRADVDVKSLFTRSGGSAPSEHEANASRVNNARGTG
jgi:hypothetical protein